jgi:hypothetical protein
MEVRRANEVQAGLSGFLENKGEKENHRVQSEFALVDRWGNSIAERSFF